MSELQEEVNKDEMLNAFKCESDINEVDIQIRVVNSIPRLAFTIGEELTRNELIPYLKEYLNKIYYFTEVQLEFATVFGEIYPHIGGAERVEVLFEIFDILATTDENSVREAAVESLSKIAEQLDDKSLKDLFMPFVLKLLNKEWFAPKTSAIALFPSCYPRVSEETKTLMREEYLKLYEDDSPMVRKVSVGQLNKFSKVLEVQYVETVTLGLFRQYAVDDQDTVRTHCVDIAITISKLLGEQLVEDHVVDILHGLANDVSWRVRLNLSNKIHEVQEALGPRLSREHLIVILKLLSEDIESIVKVGLAENIVKCCEIFHLDPTADKLIETDIMPLIQKLCKDPNELVAGKIARVLMNMANIFDNARIRTHLLPLITQSLDGERNFDEVFISNLNKLISTIGFEEIGDTVQKVMFKIIAVPATNWRTRRNLIVTVKIILKLADVDYFSKNVLPFYQKLLNDIVFSVRKTAPLILPLIIKKFGMDWAKSYLLNNIFCLIGHPNYLHRYTVLFCIDEIVTPTIQLDTGLSIVGHIEDHRHLYRICYLTDILGMILFESWIEDICKKYDHVYRDDIQVYAEETLEECMEEDFNVFESTQQDPECYLESVLYLIVKYILDIIKGLSEDKVDNIKFRCVNTIKKIITLQKKLQKDFEPVKELLKEISEEEKLQCTFEVHENLAKIETSMNKITKKVVNTDKPRTSREIKKEIIQELRNTSIGDEEKSEKAVTKEDLNIKEASPKDDGSDLDFSLGYSSIDV